MWCRVELWKACASPETVSSCTMRSARQAAAHRQRACCATHRVRAAVTMGPTPLLLPTPQAPREARPRALLPRPRGEDTQRAPTLMHGGAPQWPPTQGHGQPRHPAPSLLRLARQPPTGRSVAVLRPRRRRSAEEVGTLRRRGTLQRAMAKGGLAGQLPQLATTRPARHAPPANQHGRRCACAAARRARRPHHAGAR